MMRFGIYRLPAGSFDGELAVAIIGVLMVVGVVLLRFVPERHHPARPCTFHVVTGYPCLTCGGTRSARALGRLRFGEAIVVNPLVGLWLILALPHFMWVLVSRKWKLGRPRIRCENRRDRYLLAGAICALLGANWAYLIWVGV